MRGLPRTVFDAFHEYLLVDASDWKGRLATDAQYARFDPMPDSEAKRVLCELVVSQRSDLLTFCARGLPLAHPWMLSRAQLLESALREAGYSSPLTNRLGLPASASFYLLRRPRKAPAAAPSALPEQPVERGPPRRSPSKIVHTITVQIVNETGEPVANVPCELVFADGTLRKAATDVDGFVFLRGVVGGTCRIRLLGVAASRWKSAAGAAPSVVRTEPERTHVVRQGECLSKLALRNGVDDPMQLWNDPRNEALRQARKSPHVLLPGDSLVVPGMDIGEVQKQTDATHRLVLVQEEQLVSVRLRLEGRWRKALEGLEYTLSFMHHEQLVTRPGAGPTGPSGLIEEKVPTEVESVVVAFERPKLHFKLLVSVLDPILDVSAAGVPSGVRTRLRALGFADAGREPGVAIAQFQRSELSRAEPSGALDAETIDQLEERYGA
ncbi:MAG: hypothetical protein JWN48_450 [Myxococcaceae bacterium]|nr:hypothetical protein [Myxococcaceae bacterium]